MHPGSPARIPTHSLVTCEGCRYFRPPIAAMGRCLHDARHGYWHAQAEHRCADHSSEVETKAETPA